MKDKQGKKMGRERKKERKREINRINETLKKEKKLGRTKNIARVHLIKNKMFPM